ncbi:MAG: hypothetical protein JWM85_3025 [Acidimicrobiaceae bacterium]|jgi:hypothetical protein|nr:hypothetical protein [Acidimicrobiaceae bacterium]
MRRRTFSRTDQAVEALEHLAASRGANASCVVEAAASVIADGGPVVRELERRIVPDRRGGRRDGAGRPRGKSA